MCKRKGTHRKRNTALVKSYIFLRWHGTEENKKGIKMSCLPGGPAIRVSQLCWEE